MPQNRPRRLLPGWDQAVLADDLAELVADLAPVASGTASWLRRELPRSSRLVLRTGARTQLLDRTHPMPYALRRARLTARVSAMRISAPRPSESIGGIGVAIPNEASRRVERINRGFESETRSAFVREVFDWIDVNPPASFAASQAQESRMGDVPTSIQENQITTGEREGKLLRVGRLSRSIVIVSIAIGHQRRARLRFSRVNFWMGVFE